MIPGDLLQLRGPAWVNCLCPQLLGRTLWKRPAKKTTMHILGMPGLVGHSSSEDTSMPLPVGGSSLILKIRGWYLHYLKFKKYQLLDSTVDLETIGQNKQNPMSRIPCLITISERKKARKKDQPSCLVGSNTTRVAIKKENCSLPGPKTGRHC